MMENGGRTIETQVNVAVLHTPPTIPVQTAWKVYIPLVVILSTIETNHFPELQQPKERTQDGGERQPKVLVP